MSTSPLEGVILYDPADLAADRFCDTAIIRDGVANSALHNADESAQHIATWCAPAAAVWTEDSDPFLVPSGDLASAARRDDVYYAFALTPIYAPRVRSNGDGYRLRITIAGASSDNTTAVDFAVFVKPRSAPSWGGYGILNPSWPSKVYTGVTSSTAAMLTADVANLYLDIPRAVIDEAMDGPMPSTLTDTGGDSIGLRVALLTVVIAAKSADARYSSITWSFAARSTWSWRLSRRRRWARRSKCGKRIVPGALS